MKKDETRFTVRFNPIDPRQKTAMDVLKSSGRRKASLIADALCEYLARHIGDGAEHPHTAPLLSAAGVPETTMPGALDDTPLDDEMREAVLGGLGAFKT